ncbi:MAG TPA: nucleotidyltransferase domain-containing protein [Propionibacteriaceae bacterium]|nr:nucleotidyltransferase domain-containing protein [Propionibacteriaceae bacterium]
MLDDGALRALAERLVAVPGLLGVMLGGSRARGDHATDSDVDLGLYYRPPLDTIALRELARSVATVQRLAEARFLPGLLTKPARRANTTYVAGRLLRVVTLCAYAVHAQAGRWVINEKGIVDAADRLANAPEGFRQRAHGILAQLGTEPRQLLAAIAEAHVLVDAVETRVD